MLPWEQPLKMAQICNAPATPPAQPESFANLTDDLPGGFGVAPGELVGTVQRVKDVRAEVDRVGCFVVQYAKFQAAQFAREMFRQSNVARAVDQIGLLFVGGTGRLDDEDRDLALDEAREELEDDRFQIRRETIERAIHHVAGGSSGAMVASQDSRSTVSTSTSCLICFNSS